MDFIKKFDNFKFSKRILLLILFLSLTVTGGTYAYLFVSDNVTDAVGGNMASVDLDLDVTRVLPVDTSVNSMLLFRFNELADNLNDGCVDQDGEFALCQLYKINLKNNGSVNINVKGSLSFDNTDMPNLSWVLLGNSYSSSTNYTSSMMGANFNSANSNYTAFVNDYLLNGGTEVTYYVLLWINEINEIQYDDGNYTGIVKFEDSNGLGVTAKFEG